MSRNHFCVVLMACAAAGPLAITKAQVGLPFGPPRPLNADAETDIQQSDFAPDIATDGQGTWVATWSGDSGLGSDPFTEFVAVSRSTDNGVMWSTPFTLSQFVGASRIVNPRVISAGNGVWGIVWREDGNILVSRSLDDGSTYSSPITVGNTGGFNNSALITGAMSNRNGTWIVASRARSYRSVDNGLSWNDVTTVAGSGNVDVSEDGTWLMISNGGDVLRSTDDFSTSVPIDIGVSFGNFFTIENGASGIWHAAGWSGFDLLVFRSIDDGQTWSLQRTESFGTIFNPDAGPPEIAASGDDNWLVVWTPGGESNIFSIFSDDTGATWSPTTRVNADGEFDSLIDNQPSVATDGAGVWLVAWQSPNTLAGQAGGDLDILVAAALPNCGDGFVDAGEECDDGNDNHLDNCGRDCGVNICGDNSVNVAGEECDDGNTDGGDGCSDICLAETDDPTRIFFVAQGIDPATTISGEDATVVITPGSTIVVEAYITSPIDLRTYELFWSCRYSSDDPFAMDIVYDQTVDLGPPVTILQSSVTVDESRPDGLFAGDQGAIVLVDPGFCESNVFCTLNGDCPNDSTCTAHGGTTCSQTVPRVGFVSVFVSLPPLPGQTKYLGEIGYHIPQDAKGTYRIVFDCCKNSSGCVLNSNCGPLASSIIASSTTTSFFTHDGLLVTVDRDEACCLPDGSCQDIEPVDCELAGGTSQGPLTDCGPDADSDNVWPQCGDECPNDPNKTEPGVCGCNSPEIDTDMDGLLNCLDGCPFDPDKITPGPCGCGVDDNMCQPIPAVSGVSMVLLLVFLTIGVILNARRLRTHE